MFVGWKPCWNCWLSTMPMLNWLFAGGDTQLYHNFKIQQGLCLWLRGEQLLTHTTTATSITTMTMTTTTTTTTDTAAITTTNTKSTLTAGMVPEDMVQSFRIVPGIITSVLQLDQTAAQSIHLLPPPNAGVATVVGGNTTNNSLLGILSTPCLTKMGKAKMERWVRQPLVQLQNIQQRQDCVTALLGLGKDQIREALRHFTGIDLHHLVMTLGLYGPSQRTKKSTMQDRDDNNDDMAEPSKSALLTCGDSKKALQALHQLYLLASSKLPQLLEATQLGNNDSASASSSGTLPTLLHQGHNGLKQMCSELDRCQGLVEAVLDLDAAPRDFLVKADFKEELQDLHVELQQIQSQVQNKLERMQDLWAETSGSSGSSSQQIRLEQDASDSN